MTEIQITEKSPPLVVWSWGLAGWPLTLPVIFLAPLIGGFSLFAIERETETVHTVRTFLAARLVRQDTLGRFLQGRNELADLMEEAYQWLQTGYSSN
jgi:hypothetical protein